MSNIQEIFVGELRVGMYVSKLDRDWLDTPFLMQGFYIEDPADVDIVAEYCQKVWIDTDREIQLSAHSSNAGTAKSAPPLSNDAYTSSIEDEHKRVKTSFHRARSLTRSLLDDIRLGGALDTEAAKNTVDDCVKSVLRHPDALLWMAKVRESSEYTAEHSLNVCILAIVFGRHLGMDQQELQKIGLCGLLHDIGKMRVPAEVLNKPGALTDKEMKIMKAHTVHGRNILLSSASLFNGCVDVAYSHHERLDGLGYPRKLKDNSISQYSRIIAICDAYDAMTADRCYSPAISSTDALKIIYTEKGTQFDEDMAIKFIKAIGVFPVGSVVELNTGEAGLVIEANLRRRHLPRVILLTDEQKGPREKQKIVNLSLVETGELPKKYLIKRVCPDGSFGITLREYEQQGLVLKR